MDQEPKKETYQPPTLTCHGLIVKLTTGGSGMMQEKAVGPGMSDPNFFP